MYIHIYAYINIKIVQIISYAYVKRKAEVDITKRGGAVSEQGHGEIGQS